MANIINNNLHNLKLRLNYDEYWDFFLNKDCLYPFDFSSDKMYDNCLISYIDLCLDECVDGDNILSTNKYKWEHSYVNVNTLYNVGYTGIDNGLISFRRDLYNNRTFFNLYTDSKLTLDDDRLTLHKVSGGTLQYEYPSKVVDCALRLNGGFYQGFFQTECDKYQILPSYLDDGDVWHFEFVLNKTEFEKESNKTLNDKYPNNKGIFFYLGTRAENKWAYLYNEDDECVTWSPSDYVEDGEIKKNEYKITNMIDANPDFVDYEEFAMDEFLNFNHYSDELYEEKDIEEDDFFMDNYLVMNRKPKVIDEENNAHNFVGWCCGRTCSENYSKITYDVCCTEDLIFLSSDNTVRSNGGFLSKCDLFGDDYLSDIDTMEYGGDFIEVDLDISDFEFETFGGVSILKNQYFIDIDNKFLMFNRTCDGFDAKNWIEGSIYRYVGTNSSFKENLFLLMNRSCTGYDATNIDDYRKRFRKEYNIYNDIYDNALAFRITDEGEIGYRYLAHDCDGENGVKVKESYSKKNIISNDKWHVINARIDGMGKSMKIRFYVDGNLVFVSDEMPKLNLRELNDIREKQETVPYNISLGGGTQGLAETILPNYMLDPYRVYPIEENFAGSFIGYIKSFKFYNCIEEYMNINNNFKYEIDNLKSI